MTHTHRVLEKLGGERGYGNPRDLRCAFPEGTCPTTLLSLPAQRENRIIVLEARLQARQGAEARAEAAEKELKELGADLVELHGQFNQAVELLHSLKLYVPVEIPYQKYLIREVDVFLASLEEGRP